MAKRFGRNQRRKLREELASAERVLSAAKRSYHDLWGELQDWKRNGIKVKTEVFVDRARLNYEARIEAMKSGYDGLYVCQQIDARELAMQRERDRFIEYVARSMATQLARGIGDRW